MLLTSAQYCEENKDNYRPVPDLSEKTGLAIWKANDCSLTKGAKTRTSHVNKLIELGLPVAGDSPCVQKKSIVRKYITMTELYDSISSHKFYLAFENSYHCKEYITEKIWYNSFYLGTVPVVWGGAKDDYERLAPPHSFIHFEDFETPEKLVDYLKYLDKNDTAYMEYFKWRKLLPCSYPLYKKSDKDEHDYANINIFSTFHNTYCNLCKILQNGFHLQSSQSVSKLKDYWENDERSECLAA